MRISRKNQDRIRRAIHRVERFPRPRSFGRPLDPRRGSPFPMLGYATADINPRSSGTVVLAEEIVGDFLESAQGETFQVYNPNLTIWQDSLVLLQWVGRKRSVVVQSDLRWLITWTNSARRIRGVATEAIDPGDSGTIGTLIPIDGVFGGSEIEAYLPTEYVAVDANKVVWCELTFGEVVGYRWEIYSADCEPPEEPV